jgi:RimJ/RimL family protein N-acetyltransferase
MVLYDWLDKRISLAWSTDFRALGRVIDGKLVGVVGYNGFNGASCQMHMAGDGLHWINKQFIRKAFELPFVQWKLNMVMGLVPSGNESALVIDKKLGFQEVATIDGAHPDGALLILMMKRENCRWLAGGQRGEKERTTGTAGSDA